jgi:hypothetical protein
MTITLSLSPVDPCINLRSLTITFSLSPVDPRINLRSLTITFSLSPVDPRINLDVFHSQDKMAFSQAMISFSY